MFSSSFLRTRRLGSPVIGSKIIQFPGTITGSNNNINGTSNIQFPGTINGSNNNIQGNGIIQFPGIINGSNNNINGTSNIQFPGTIGPNVDPNFANVSLLLHFDSGTNVLVDSSSYASNGTLTSAGAAISTADSKFGGSSMRYTYQDGWSVTWTGSQFSRNVGQAYTFEFWWKHISNSYNSTISPMTMWWQSSFNDNMFYLAHYSNSNQYVLRIGTSSELYGTFTLSQWNHWAVVVLENNTYVLYINGVASQSGIFNSSTSPSGKFSLGNWNTATPTYTADGYIDELRLTKGIARYTANFTPPTAPFPSS